MVRQRRKHHFWRNLIILIVLFGIYLCWGNSSIETDEVTFPSGTLPAGSDGCRIVHLSDLHGKYFGKDNERLYAAVRAAQPEYIFVTGDLVDRGTEEPNAYATEVGAALSAIAPTYYVTGNHEWAAGVVRELEPLLEQCGVTVLSNEYVMLERNGDRIALLGAEDSNGYADQKTVQELADQVRQEQGAVYEILLSHRNNHYEQYTQARVDLTLAGHAHGGLIRLPGTDGLVGPKRELFPQYTAGLYDLSYGQMVVSRGLGNQFPCFRLLNRPDVPLVVLG